MNAHDGVRQVVLAREELLDFRLLDLPPPLVQMGLEVAFDALPFTGPLDEGAGLVLAMLELLDDVDLPPQMAPLAGELLAFRRIRPDPGVGELLLYFGEGFSEGGFVKDNLERRSRGGRGPRIV